MIGPVGLQRFESRIPPGAASFSFGAEALTARYLDGSTLTIFNYPVPSMARDRVDEFRKIPGAVAKRAGPMAAVVLGAPNPEASERLLGQVAYQAQVTWNEPAPGQEMRAMAHGIVTMILLAFAICGMCILGGLVVGGFLVFRRRSSKGQHDQALTTLGLG